MLPLHCRTEKYLEHLAAFGAAHSQPDYLLFDWTSPLARQPDRFQRFQGLPYEHAMVRILVIIIIITNLLLPWATESWHGSPTASSASRACPINTQW